MNYAQIRQFDVANGEGIRTSFFVTGCTHCCEGCFNEVYQDFKYGQPWTENETELILSHLSHPMVKGLTILGGEPFQNVEGLLPVLQKIKQESPKTIWIYSGYTVYLRKKRFDFAFSWFFQSTNSRYPKISYIKSTC